MLSIGIDIVDISNFESYNKSNDKFLKRFFTKKEIDYCFSFKSPFQHIAGKFAAKEAIIKAFSQGRVDFGDFSNIEILNASNGVPYVNFLSTIKNNLITKLSITHDSNKAVAVAILMDKSYFTHSQISDK